MTKLTFSAVPDRKYCYWLESDNEEMLRKAAKLIEDNFPEAAVWVSHFDEIRLAACGCGWKQEKRDPYNYFGCPKCMGKL